MTDFYKWLIEQCPSGYAYQKIICQDGVPVDYEFLEVNSAFSRFIGHKIQSIVGKNISQIAPSYQSYNWLEEYGKIALNGGSADFVQYSKAWNKWYKIHTFSPEKNYFVTYINDLTQELHSIVQLDNCSEVPTGRLIELNRTPSTNFIPKTSMKDSEGFVHRGWKDIEADKLKTEFVANMSHELKTPLNSLLGMAELLATTPLNSIQAEYVRKGKKAGETLLALINNVLDMAKMDSGELELETRTFNIHDLVRRTIAQMSPRADHKELDIQFSLAKTVPPWVTGDKARLEQILANLLDNAIKFTEQGQVTLEVKPIASKQHSVDKQGIVLLFAIRDTGLGIPRGMIKKIFKDFTQADSSTTRVHEGSGLGLAITRRLVKLMKGDIWVESTPGQGSTFYCSLPLSLATTMARSKTDALNILLVEDSEDNRFLVQHYLKSTPHQLEIAVNGKEAVTKAQSKCYDLILMDIQMPVMDGCQATRAIRAWEKSAGRGPVPIVALTAYTINQAALTSGFDAYLTKPIKKSTLLDFVNSYVDAPTAGSLGAGSTWTSGMNCI